MGRFRWARSPAAWLGAAYCVLVVGYALATPLYESTDEIRHFRYVRYLQAFRALPEQTGDPARNAQAHHPPLYYLTAALASAWVPGGAEAPVFFEPPINPFWGYRYFEPGTDNKAQYLHGADEAWPWRGNPLIAHVSRLVSALFGLGAVVAAYRLGQAAFPARSGLAVGAASFVAFNPNFLHLAASINNDVPAAFFGAAALLASARILRRGNTPRLALVLGAALGLGLLTKTNTAALLIPGLLAIGLRASRDRAWRPGLQSAVIVAACLLLLSGWWFARNQVLYGDLTGTADYVALWRGEADQARLFREMLSNLPYAWTTLWGRFGYGQAPLPAWAYGMGAALLALAGLGWLAGAGAVRHAEDPGQWAILLAGLVAALAAWAALMVTIPATANARMIFAVYPVLGLLTSAGLASWAVLAPPVRRGRVEALIVAGMALGLFGYALSALFGTLRPAFAPPRLLRASDLPPGAARVDASLAGVAEIVGYQASAASGLPGEAVDLTVYWRPLAQTATPWTVFVHLLDDDGIPIAQRQTYPGLGNYPTTAWLPGGVFADTYRVHLPETAYAPNHGQWRVGLFDLETGERLGVFDSSGQQVGDSVALARFDLRARPGPVPNSSEVNFGGRVQLVGYELDRRTVRPGETIGLTLYWTALAVEADYWAYAHVVAVDGSIWAIGDSEILPPPTAWQPGEIVREARSLRLAADTPAGLHEIRFGVTRVDESGQRRLPILGEDGHEIGDQLALATIRVSAEK